MTRPTGEAPTGTPFWAVLVCSLIFVYPAAVQGAADAASPLPTEKIRRVIIPKVAHLRGLRFTRDVPVESVGREEAAVYAATVLDETLPAQDLVGYQRLLSHLDLIPPATDLRKLLIDSYAASVAAWYDDEKKTFSMVGAYKETVFDEQTVAHELTHALQDQHFDLGALRRLTSENDDAALAVAALAEGDACDLMLRYNSGAERGGTGAVNRHWRFIAAGMPSEATSGMPLFIVQNMTFPYTYGTRFLQRILEEAGPAAVDIAFRDPPVSSEQVITPEKYLYRDEPQLIDPGDLSGALGEHWRMVEAGAVGQFNLGVLLAVHLGESAIDEAVSDWDGDLLIGWWRDDPADCCLAYCSVWDTPSGARDFFKAAAALAGMRAPMAAERFETDRTVSWQYDGRLTYLSLHGCDVLYVENMPHAAAGKVIMRFRAAAKRPFGTVVPIADRDRRQPGTHGPAGDGSAKTSE